MAIASEPSEEEDAIIHGTTLEAANAIFAQRKFAERETWFASTPDLATYFALRTCQKGAGGQPAVIKVPVYRSDLHWRYRV
jgi:hypothetical protein